MIRLAYHADRLDRLEASLGHCKFKKKMLRFLKVSFSTIQTMKNSNFFSIYNMQPYVYLRERIDHEDNLVFGRINTVLMVQSIFLLGMVTWIVSDKFSLSPCWIATTLGSLIGGTSSLIFTIVGNRNILLIRLLHTCIYVCIDPKTESEEPVHKIVRISNPSMSYLSLYSGTLWAFPFLWLGLTILAGFMAICCR